MKKLISKIACVVMAFTLITGVCAGCKSDKSDEAESTAELPSYTSVTDESGNLPVNGTVGDMEYRIMGEDEFGCYNKPRGYYYDQLEQLDSPLFIVISAGTQTRTGGELKITDLGMQGSKLVIVVEETEADGEEYDGLDCPCAVLELDKGPEELLIVSTTGEEFGCITP